VPVAHPESAVVPTMFTANALKNMRVKVFIGQI
jgi:hypothetical protein